MKVTATPRTFACAAALLLIFTAPAMAQEPAAPADGAEAASAPPAPPSNLQAEDHAFDGGEQIDLSWELSPDDERLAGYKVYRSRTPDEIEALHKDERAKAMAAAKDEVTESLLEQYGESDFHALDDAQIAQLRARRAAAALEAGQAYDAEVAARQGQISYKFETATLAGVSEHTIDKLDRTEPYVFMVEAFLLGGTASEPVITPEAVSPVLQWFDGGRFFLAVITVVLCGAVIFWILHARSGKPIKVRKIAGLEAVDEAVGRATEMGRPVLFVPGIQDMNDIQTIAGITVLSRVARTAAEYDAKVEVPTSRSLVMTTAREAVQASYLAAGRPDAYNADLIYYVTDEQFGYVAYLSGMMVREKPAACFYMGSFFAESLILAETGNAVGAIQVAGTAQPAQLPFFVAACDYTLIGEEFFAASAYLSGSPEELGSLKGQDLGKIIVAVGMLVGIFFVTLAVITESDALMGISDWIKDKLLT